jgi:antitoxin component YwqK of YwqJK toxin-antitoxin module
MEMTKAVLEGLVMTYRPDGSVLAKTTYAAGVMHGPYRDFWPHGGVSLEGQYRDGMQDGEWRFYDRKTGKLRETIQFVAGLEVTVWNSSIKPAQNRE